MRLVKGKLKIRFVSCVSDCDKGESLPNGGVNIELLTISFFCVMFLGISICEKLITIL